ncbi:aldose 1-epimerase [Rhodovibrionaceae bacterium A322]
MAQPPLELRHGALRLRLSSEIGGHVLAFYSQPADPEEGVWHWFRPSAHDDVGSLDSSSYPLVPYSNRIADAHFEFEGQPVQLPLNFLPEPHSIHGIGWELEWQVIRQSSDEVVLELDYDGKGAWPWAFSSQQQLTLDETGLSHSISLRNESQQNMPGGLGLHPFFPAPEGAKLQLSATGFIERDARGLPDWLNEQHPVLAELREGSGMPRGVDTGLEGWDGRARVVWPQAGRCLEIRAPDITRAIYFSPPGEDFICVEPISHVTNVVNGLPKGMTGSGGARTLAPGEEMSVAVRYEVGELSGA